MFWSDADGAQQRAIDPASGALLPLPWGYETLPFLFMITLTGLAIFYSSYMPLPLRAAYGADDGAYERDGVTGAVLQLRRSDPHMPQTVGHATHSVVEHLHFARFGG